MNFIIIWKNVRTKRENSLFEDTFAKILFVTAIFYLLFTWKWVFKDGNSIETLFSMKLIRLEIVFLFGKEMAIAWWSLWKTGKSLLLMWIQKVDSRLKDIMKIDICVYFTSDRRQAKLMRPLCLVFSIGWGICWMGKFVLRLQNTKFMLRQQNRYKIRNLNWIIWLRNHTQFK